MIGLLLHTFHTSPVPCDDTTGVYVLANGFGAGLLKNSECRPGAWAGWAPETNVLTIDHAKAKAGLIAGVIAGYKSHPIFPLLVPSVAVSFDSKLWVRASFLSPVNSSPGGVTFSLEYPF